MTTTYRPVAARKIIRDFGLANVGPLFLAALKEGLYLPAACALMQKESGGRNVYGHDEGGALSGFPRDVNEENFAVFWWLVNDQGQTSNGVGPAQLTYPGFFEDMLANGQHPWSVVDNMRVGFRLLKGYHDDAVAAHTQRPWVAAGTRYNGALSYGEDLATKVHQWADRLRSAEVTA